MSKPGRRGKNNNKELKEKEVVLQRNESKPTIAEEPQVSPSPATTFATGQAEVFEINNKKRRPSLETLINGAMALFTFVLMFYAIRQWEVSRESLRVAHDANRQSREHFQQDQRPYVWLTNNLGSPECVSGQKSAQDCQIIWSWHFTNYGKTPARDLRFTQMINFGENVLEKPRMFDKISIGAPLPPNKDDFSTALSEVKINRAEFARLLNTEQSILVSGRLNYTDGLGGQYETGFCLYRLRSGAIAYCRDGNYVK